MPRDRDEPAAVRVYTVCDESKYLIVRNVPALGCGDELGTLFSTYGPLEECKHMDAEDCEEYTDVFFIKFAQVSNARFAKRKLDESVFLGNRLQVSYAPQFESLEDTKEKLEVRRKEVLGRIRSPAGSRPEGLSQYSLGQGSSSGKSHHQMSSNKRCKHMDAEDCEEYTDVFFIKFAQVNNARFAKRKLDESVFLGNRLQVSYAPQFESLEDTKEKLEVRRKEVLGRIRSPAGSRPEGLSQYSLGQGSSSGKSQHQMSSNKREYTKTFNTSHMEDARFSHVSSNKDYFPSQSMNATVNLVRQKLDKIQSGSDTSNADATSKKPRVDNRRRI